VTDTPSVQAAVARYVNEQNLIMNRQVALNVEVLSVGNSRNEDFRIDWNLVYKSLHSAGATLNNATGISLAVFLPARPFLIPLPVMPRSLLAPACC
jgi:hypothetical protein